jgi:hypothetical protein
MNQNNHSKITVQTIRHCARSKAIAYTTDRLGVSATASYLKELRVENYEM